MTLARRLAIPVLLAALTALAAAAPPPAAVGALAPGFELVDLDGRRHDLADYRGHTVILEWTNPDCPYVQRLYTSKAMNEAVARVRAIDPKVVWLAIDSTHDAAPDTSRAWARRHQVKHPVMLDGDGTVGRRFDARRTPEMIVIDGEGRVRYRGAIDDNRLGRLPKNRVTNYVVEAVGQLTRGEPVRPDFVKPYGCKIKYRR